jgi:hypothetical protein
MTAVAHAASSHAVGKFILSSPRSRLGCQQARTARRPLVDRSRARSIPVTSASRRARPP